MKLTKALFFSFVSCLVWTQLGFSQHIISADGKDMGLRSEYMVVCTGGDEEAFFDYGGTKVSRFKLCGCIADSLIPRLTEAQVNYFFTEGNYNEVFKNEEYLRIIFGCALGSFRSINMDQEIGNIEHLDSFNVDIEQVLGSLQGMCRDLLQTVPQFQKISSKQEESYEFCGCFTNGILGKHFTYRDAYTYSGRRSDEVEGIRMNCLNWVLLGDSVGITQEYPRPRLTGPEDLHQIPLISHERLRVSIGDTTLAMRIIPNVDELIIDAATETRLKELYVLNARNAAGELSYELNGKKYPTRVYLLEAFKMGDYFLHDVPLIVMDETEPIIGGRVLNCFRLWEIDGDALKVLK
jgi:hypothetical protein